MDRYISRNIEMQMRYSITVQYYSIELQYGNGTRFSLTY